MFKGNCFLITDWLKLRQEGFVNILTGERSLEHGKLQLQSQAKKYTASNIGIAI